MFNIVTIGSATRDVFLESNDFRDIKSHEFSSGVGECLALGSKNEVQQIFFTTGGGATNAAVTFARLGLRVACVARVGHDDAGEEIIKVLRRENVDTRFIQKDARDSSAYSTLLMHGPGERTILVYRGASVKLSFVKRPNLDALCSERKRAKEGDSVSSSASWFYVTSLGGNLALIKKIWSFARINNIKIAWNPGGEELKFGWRKLLPFIKQCEVFNVNREEASRLTSCDWKNLKCIFNKLYKTSKIILITDGKRGAYALLAESTFHVSSLGTKPRNTTGAGDAFGSGFVAGLILFETEPRRTKKTLSFGLRLRQKLSVDQVKRALRLAILNADSVIRQMGAKVGILKKMPSRKEFDKVKIKILDLRIKI